MRFLLPIALVFALAPATASAVTVKEIVSLSKAGVSEPVILALIDRDKSIFTLQAEDLVTLQKEGVSDAVVLAMLRSGRDEAPLPPAPVAAPAPEPSQPDIVMVGHGPDQPDASGNYSASAGTAVPYAVPYFVAVPYPVAVAPARARCVVPTDTRPAGSDPTGVFFRNASRGVFFPNPPAAERVVECPPAPARQPRRR